MADNWMSEWDESDMSRNQTLPPEHATAFEHDYGLTEMRQVENRRPRVQSIPLVEIRPDLRQARRTLPFEMRESWYHDPSDGVAIMQDWYRAALRESAERGRGIFDPVEILSGQMDMVDEPAPGPIEARLLKILLDASTAIPNGGISTPIQVWRNGDWWMLESGERRTLMHWALVAWIDAEQFQTIRALKTEAFSVLNQAAENSARQDLNAIERARQLAIVLFHFYPEAERLAYNEAESDQAYYAQAADLRTPRGQGDMLLAATGLSSNRQKSRYQALLTLPDRAWNLADHFGWSEGKIRELVERAGGWDNLIMDQLVHYSEIEAGIIVPPISSKAPPDRIDFDMQVARVVDRSVRALRQIANMKPEFREVLTQEERRDLIALAQAILDRFKDGANG